MNQVLWAYPIRSGSIEFTKRLPEVDQAIGWRGEETCCIVFVKLGEALHLRFDDEPRGLLLTCNAGVSTRWPVGWVQIVGTAVAVLLLAPIFAWKLRNRSADVRHLYFGPEGFVAETMRRAQKASWEATFLVVMLLAVLDETLARVGLPPEFYLEGIVALMTGIFGVTFLVLNRVERSDSPEEMEDVAGA